MPHILPLNPQNFSAQKENTLTKASHRSKINVSLNNANSYAKVRKKAASSENSPFILYKNLFSLSIVCECKCKGSLTLQLSQT